MAKYTIKHTCGHESTQYIVGTNSNGERDRQVAYYESTLCAACYDIQRIADAKVIKNSMSDLGFAELKGSDKQIVWAEKIRASIYQELIDRCEKELARAKKNIEQGRGDPKEIEKWKTLYCLQRDTILDILKKQKSVSWWIDVRSGLDTVIEKVEKEAEARVTAITQTQNDAKDEDAIAAIAEATVTPQDVKKPDAVEISLDENRVCAKYKKDNDFRTLVRELGYSWNSELCFWEIKINQQTGSASDRAAELGNALLNNGYVIIIFDTDTRRKAIEADFEKRHWRWITVLADNNYDKAVAIKFPKDDNLYEHARKIRGTWWKDPYVMAPITSYKLILDFADINDFRLTPLAAARINAYKDSLRPPVSPSRPKEQEPVDRLAEILESDSAVIEDLKDEDNDGTV